MKSLLYGTRPGLLGLCAILLLSFTSLCWSQAAPMTPMADAPATPVAEAPGTDAPKPPPTIQDAIDGTGTLRNETNTLWICLAAFLVFFMQLGFLLVECGLTRAKNANNIIMKNTLDFCFGTIIYWCIGFFLMFGVTSGETLLAKGFFYNGTDLAGTDIGVEKPFDWGFLIFQTVFCATAATIVSGAMAERTKFSSYLIYTVVISAVIYPIFGNWCWTAPWSTAAFEAKSATQGWLVGGDLLTSIAGAGAAFHDFAGSTVVHSVGGWVALAGAMVIGPRLGKYGKGGKINPIPGHSIPMAAMGVFILWLGWFGFNPGSTTVVDGGAFAKVCVTTNIAACTGTLGAMCTAWILFGKPDVSMSLNGALAGLVAITAGCNAVTVHWAALIGLIGGILVVFAVVFFDKIKVDDPVGAISVHCVNGVWGTLAIGLFKDVNAETGIGGLLVGGNATQFIAQVAGVLACCVWSFGLGLVLFLALKYTVGLRVSEKEEIEGLDIGEHGSYAYPPIMVADIPAGTAHGIATGAMASTAYKPSIQGA